MMVADTPKRLKGVLKCHVLSMNVVDRNGENRKIRKGKIK